MNSRQRRRAANRAAKAQRKADRQAADQAAGASEAAVATQPPPEESTGNRYAGIERMAMARGWEAPQPKRPELVDSQIEIALDRNQPAVERTRAFNAVARVDQMQWLRDNPAKRMTPDAWLQEELPPPPTPQVNVQVNVGTPAPEPDQDAIIESDPEIARLENEILSLRIAKRQTDTAGVRELLQPADYDAAAPVLPQSGSQERGHNP